MTTFQKAVWDHLVAELQVFKRAPDPERMRVAANYAWALYDDLKRAGRTVTFRRQLLDNRKSSADGVTPDVPGFYHHTAALEDFLAEAGKM